VIIDVLSRLDRGPAQKIQKRIQIRCVSITVEFSATPHRSGNHKSSNHVHIYQNSRNKAMSASCGFTLYIIIKMHAATH